MADQNFRVKRGLEVGVGATVLTTTAAGNIGIGTTNPTSKLDVVGDIKVSGVITATTFSGNATTATFATNAGIATNLKGGLVGNIPYQSAADTTAFLTNGSAGSILQSNGVGNAPSWVSAAPSNAITGLTIRDEGTIVGNANSITQLNFVGNIVSAAATAGIATITFADFVSTAGFATVAGISTNVIGGIASVTQLNVSGVATIGVITANNLFVSGIATIPTLTGTTASFGTLNVTTGNIVTGVITNAQGTNVNYTGVGTIATLNSTVGTITNLGGTNVNYSGVGTIATLNSTVATLTNLGGTNVNYTGVGTITTLNSTVATLTNLGGTNVNYTGVGTVGSLKIGATQVISSARQLQNIASLDATTTATIESAIANAPNTFTDLQVTGISTFTNGPVFIGSGTSTGTASQRLQVTGGAYVSSNTGIGTTNPSSLLTVQGNALITGIATVNSNLIVNGNTLVADATNNRVGILTTSPIQPFQVGAAGTNVVVVDSIGQVGIGTTNSLQKLHVLGNLLVAAGSSTAQHITQKAYELNNGTLSWEGSAGQLFSITNNLTSGSIFSVNDVSGIPSIDVNADGTVALAPFGTNENVGIGTTRPTSKFHVSGNGLVVGILTATTFSGTLLGYASTAGIATNLKGGSGGTLVYQSAVDTTAFLANGSSGQILQSNGGTNAPTWVPAAPSNAITGLTIRDEGTIVSTANSFSQLNFVGNIVSVAGTGPSGIATITFADFVSNSGTSTSVIGGIGSLSQLQVTGASTFTAANAGAVIIRSGASGSYTTLSLGRTGGEGTLAVPAASGQFAADASAGDIVLRTEVAGSKLLLLNGSGNSALAVSGNNVLVGTVSSTGTASQRLQVTGGAYVSGNLGVAATNPLARLSIGSGSINDTNLPVQISTPNATGQIYYGANNNGAYGALFGYDRATYGGGVVRVVGATDNLDFVVNNTTRAATILPSGNVGIGTTNPSDKLHVLGGNVRVDSSTGAINFWSGGGWYGGFGLAAGLGGAGIDIAIRAEPNRSIIFFTNGANDRGRIDSSGTFLVGSATSTGTASQRLQVTGGGYFAGVGVATGSIGIGITNPQGAIDIRTSPQWSSFNWGANLIIGGSRNNALGILDSSNSNPWAIGNGAGTLLIAPMPSLGNTTTGLQYALQVTRSGNLIVGSGSSTGTAAQLLQVSGGAYVSGNLGIGTTNPSSTLDVRSSTGTIRAQNYTSNLSVLVDANINGPRISFGAGGDNSFMEFGAYNNLNNLDSKVRDLKIFSTAAPNAFTLQQSTGNIGINSTAPTSRLDVIGDAKVSGVVTATTFVGALTGIAASATQLVTPRNFSITGNFVTATAISFNGTGNVALAATITPNSIGLGTYTSGDYVQSISGTANQITVTSGTGEGSTPTLSVPNQFTAPEDVTVTRDLQVNRNLNVNGNITIGGTSANLFSQSLNVFDPDIILGFRTDALGNDISNDNTANHGGVAVASTEGTPLVQLFIAGIETNPATYKKIMWFKSGSFSGLGTDAWLMNYAVGIGSTQFPVGTRLAAGNVQITENDLAVVRNINASGIVTASNLNISGVSTFTAANAGAVQIRSGASGSYTFLDIGRTTGDFSIGMPASGGQFAADAAVGDAVFRLNTGKILFSSAGNASSLTISGSNVLVGTVSSTGTSSQPLQVTGGAYVSGNLGIGTINPTSKLHVVGDTLVTGVSTFQSNVFLGDNDTLYFGDGNDLEIYHDGSNSVIKDAGTGILVLGGSGAVQITNAALTEFSARFISDGAVELYFDNVKEFETTGYGATVYGTLQTQQLNVSGIATASTFIGNLTGTATTSSNVIGGIGSLSQLQVTGVSTFTNGPVLIGSGTSTGTASQRLQVTGGAYVSGSVGIGTTNPTSALTISKSQSGIVNSSHLNLENPASSNAQTTLAFTFGGTVRSNIRVDGNGNFVLNANNNAFYYNVDFGSSTFSFLTSGFTTPWLQVTGGNKVGIATNSASATLQVKDALAFETTNTTTTNTNQVAVDTFATATFRSAKYQVQVTCPGQISTLGGITTGGRGYTAGTYNVTFTTSSGNGSAAQGTLTISNGTVGQISVSAGGTGYVTGDVLTASGGSGLQVSVGSTGASGNITSLTLSSAGTGYTGYYNATTGTGTTSLSLLGGTGFNAVGLATIFDGVITSSTLLQQPTTGTGGTVFYSGSNYSTASVLSITRSDLTNTITTITGSVGVSTFTSLTAHGIGVSDVVRVSSTSNGLTAGTDYYVVTVPSTTTFTLGTSVGVGTTFTTGSSLSIGFFRNSAANGGQVNYTNAITGVSTNFQASDLMVLQNGTTADFIEYATIANSDILGTFASDISGANARLLFTPTYPNNNVKVARQAITV